jgi:hypothetical protein
MTQFIDLVTIQKGFFLSNLVLFVTLGNEIRDMKIEIQDIPSGSLARNLDGIGLSK